MNISIIQNGLCRNCLLKIPILFNIQKIPTKYYLQYLEFACTVALYVHNLKADYDNWNLEAFYINNQLRYKRYYAGTVTRTT